MLDMLSNHAHARRPVAIATGDQMIGPDMASRILSECFFDGQAKRMKTSRMAILMHVDRLRRGRWLANSQITFCRLPTGDLYLVNGYHRVSAIVEFGKPASFNVQVYDVDDMDGVSSKYALFDAPKSSRVRGDGQLMNALGFAERLGCSKDAARALFRASILIRNKMKPVREGDRESLLEMYNTEDRADFAMTWADECRLADECLHGASRALKDKMLNPSVFSVILCTLRYQRERAISFWTAVAKNDGLRKGTPEHTLVQRLVGERMVGGDMENFIVPALAWNAYFRGLPLTMIKSGVTNDLKILGTPVGKAGL